MGRLVRWLVLGGGIAAGAALFIMMLVMATEVFSRYVLSRPTYWALEVSVYLLVAVAALGAPFTLRRGSHVAVELFRDRLPLRGRLAAHYLTLLVILGVSLVLVWFGIRDVALSVRLGNTSLTPLAMPLAYPLALIPIGGALLALQACEMLLRPPPTMHRPVRPAESSAL